jgi:CheY-like chemotaxis protein
MSKRILVVEDQPDNRQIIRDMLATNIEIKPPTPKLLPTASPLGIARFDATCPRS